jgi:hypothetical protein
LSEAEELEERVVNENFVSPQLLLLFSAGAAVVADATMIRNRTLLFNIRTIIIFATQRSPDIILGKSSLPL